MPRRLRKMGLFRNHPYPSVLILGDRLPAVAAPEARENSPSTLISGSPVWVRPRSELVSIDPLFYYTGRERGIQGWRAGKSAPSGRSGRRRSTWINQCHHKLGAGKTPGIRMPTVQRLRIWDRGHLARSALPSSGQPISPLPDTTEPPILRLLHKAGLHRVVVNVSNHREIMPPTSEGKSGTAGVSPASLCHYPRTTAPPLRQPISPAPGTTEPPLHRLAVIAYNHRKTMPPISEDKSGTVCILMPGVSPASMYHYPALQCRP